MGKLLATSIFSSHETIKSGKRNVGFAGALHDQSCIVTFTDGHLYELETPDSTRWTLDALPFPIPNEYSVSESKQSLGAFIHRVVGSCERLILACDPDSQGSYIADLVRRMAGFKGEALMGALNSTDSDRIKDQYSSFEKMEKFSRYLPIAASEACRARLDNHIGINLTRLFTIIGQSKCVDKLEAKLVIGRLQSSVLGIVARRHYEIANFKPERFHTFYADLTLDSGETVTMEIEGLRVFDEEERDEVLKRLNEAKVEITNIETKRKHIEPPEPFKQSSLQIHMGKLYHYSPSKVLEAAAANYEAGFQSYPRTDGNDVEYKDWFAAERILKDTLTDIDISELNFKRRGRTVLGEGVTPQAAHTAIIPTGRKWSENENSIKHDVFKEVVKRFAMMFMPDRIIENTTIVAECAGYTLKARGSVEIQDGWYKYESLKPKNKTGFLPKFDYETSFTSKVYSKKSSTRAPNRYQEHEIIEEMEHIGKHIPDSHQDLAKFYLADENGGLGSSATRAPAIEKTLKHGILKTTSIKDNTYIVPSKIGLALYNALPIELTDLTVFAQWERDFIFIKDKKKRMSEVLKEHAEYIDRMVDRFKYNPNLFNFKPPIEATGYECPYCFSAAVKRTSKIGTFWVCINKEKCGKQISDYNDAPLDKQDGDGEKCNADNCDGVFQSYAGMSKAKDGKESKPYICLRCNICKKFEFNYKRK